MTAAIGASRPKGSYCKDKFHRLRARVGTAGGHGDRAQDPGRRLPHAGTGAPFRDLGEAYLDQQARRRTTANLIRRLDTLGYDVMLQPRASA